MSSINDESYLYVPSHGAGTPEHLLAGQVSSSLRGHSIPSFSHVAYFPRVTVFGRINMGDARIEVKHSVITDYLPHPNNQDRFQIVLASHQTVAQLQCSSTASRASAATEKLGDNHV